MSKQRMLSRYLYGSILGLGLSGGHLYSLAVPLLPLISYKNKQTLVMRERDPECYASKYPLAINHLWVL